jgi:hypothetical protein
VARRSTGWGVHADESQNRGSHAFEIRGTLLDSCVFASWDGMHLTLSGGLWNVVSSSARCFEENDDGLVCSGDPRRVALQLVQALNDMVSIEFGVWCDREAVSRRWHFEGTTSNELVGGLIAERG